MIAGNIVAKVKTISIDDTSGLLKLLPVSGLLWFAGILAISGMPPFSIFVSKFSIFRQAFDSGQYAIGIAMLFLIGLIFIGLTIEEGYQLLSFSTLNDFSAFFLDPRDRGDIQIL